MKKNKGPRIDTVTQEILNKGKDIVKDFDDSEGVYVEPKPLESKLISIRLPMVMISNLRIVARLRGDIGYQQIIKTYIAEGLERDNQRIQHNMPLQVSFGEADLSASSSCEAPPSDILSGVDLVPAN